MKTLTENIRVDPCHPWLKIPSKESDHPDNSARFQVFVIFRYLL
jgi:hypothetical protein